MLRRFPFIEWKKLSGQERGVGNLVKFREQDDWGKKSRGPTLSSETGNQNAVKSGAGARMKGKGLMKGWNGWRISDKTVFVD